MEQVTDKNDSVLIIKFLCVDHYDHKMHHKNCDKLYLTSL